MSMERASELVMNLGPVEPGSIIVIDEEVAEWTDDGYDELPAQLLHMIQGAVGHDRFVVVRAPAGTSPIAVIGPSEAAGALGKLCGTPNPLDLCRAIVWLQEVADAAAVCVTPPPAPEGIYLIIKGAHDRLREAPAA